MPGATQAEKSALRASVALAGATGSMEPITSALYKIKSACTAEQWRMKLMDSDGDEECYHSPDADDDGEGGSDDGHHDDDDDHGEVGEVDCHDSGEGESDDDDHGNDDADYFLWERDRTLVDEKYDKWERDRPINGNLPAVEQEFQRMARHRTRLSRRRRKTTHFRLLNQRIGVTLHYTARGVSRPPSDLTLAMLESRSAPARAASSSDWKSDLLSYYKEGERGGREAQEEEEEEEEEEEVLDNDDDDDDEAEEQSTAAAHARPTRRGSKLVYEEHPEVLEIILDFLAANGHQEAQIRRRPGGELFLGSSLQDIVQEVQRESNVPFSKAQLYFMFPPRREETKQAQRHSSVIPGRLCHRTADSISKDHPDAHHCAATLKYVREMSSDMRRDVDLIW
jgi:hypothetical protein